MRRSAHLSGPPDDRNREAGFGRIIQFDRERFFKRIPALPRFLEFDYRDRRIAAGNFLGKRHIKVTFRQGYQPRDQGLIGNIENPEFLPGLVFLTDKCQSQHRGLNYYRIS